MLDDELIDEGKPPTNRIIFFRGMYPAIKLIIFKCMSTNGLYKEHSNFSDDVSVYRGLSMVSHG